MHPRSQSLGRWVKRRVRPPMTTLIGGTTMLDTMLALFRPHAAAILGDEMGDETARTVELVLDTLGDEHPAAYWLEVGENWDSVLDGLTP